MTAVMKKIHKLARIPRERKIKRGAEDFAKRFEGVMRDLADG